MTDRLIDYLRSALADVPSGFAPFQVLSDEETAAIEEHDASPYTVRPWIELQQQVDHDLAARCGRRSLVLRRLLRKTVDQQTGQAQLLPSDELRFLADARRSGVGYLLARSSYRNRRSARNNVLQAEVGSYEEDVDADGFHVFAACAYATALRRLAEWALPAIDHRGAPTRTCVAAKDWGRWLADVLGTDLRAVEINTFLPDGAGDWTPETWSLAHSGQAAVLAVANGDTINVTSMTLSRLETQLRVRVSDALRVSI